MNKIKVGDYAPCARTADKNGKMVIHRDKYYNFLTLTLILTLTVTLAVCIQRARAFFSVQFYTKVQF